MTTTSPTLADRGDGPDKPKTVNVVFNTLTIPMPKGKHTGAEIKGFAIDAGIAIAPHFSLAIRVGKKFRDVSDTDVVNVTEGEEFSATDGDDNS